MAALSPDADPLSRAGRWLSVVGIGEDGRGGLSPAAARALDAARVVYGGRRHLALAGPLDVNPVAMGNFEHRQAQRRVHLPGCAIAFDEGHLGHLKPRR